MKAIVTHYLPATEARGSRIKATAEGGNTRTIEYDHGSSNVHRKAAEALCDWMGWPGELMEGGLSNGDMVFVFYEESTIAKALKVLVDHASEAFPHFESERGQRDIAAANAALDG